MERVGVSVSRRSAGRGVVVCACAHDDRDLAPCLHISVSCGHRLYLRARGRSRFVPHAPDADGFHEVPAAKYAG